MAHWRISRARIYALPIRARIRCACNPVALERANQSDIIDLTCDLEIRKIADEERFEPIIIVNTGPRIRPPLFLSVFFLSLSSSTLSLGTHTHGGEFKAPLVSSRLHPRVPETFIYINFFDVSFFFSHFFFLLSFLLLLYI